MDQAEESPKIKNLSLLWEAIFELGQNFKFQKVFKKLYSYFPSLCRFHTLVKSNSILHSTYSKLQD
jgi:hypothetical protein